MNRYTLLPVKLKPYFREELTHYKTAIKAADLSKAWRHLERAHIIGQRYAFAHSYVHWKMLQFGFRIKNTREIIGQIPRLLVGGVKSFIGKVPVGNPGGANVPPLQSFPIAEDIQLIFKKAGLSSHIR